MDPSEATVNTLLLPLNGYHLLLPQASVAEIAPRPQVTAMETTPAWLRGVFNWRAEQLALVSFELLTGQAAASPPVRSKVAVLYGLEGLAGLSFYALELQATPQPVRLNADMLGACGDGTAHEHGLVTDEVAMHGQRAVIPNLGRIESLLGEQLKRM